MMKIVLLIFTTFVCHSALAGYSSVTIPKFFEEVETAENLELTSAKLVALCYYPMAHVWDRSYVKKTNAYSLNIKKRDASFFSVENPDEIKLRAFSWRKFASCRVEVVFKGLDKSRNIELESRKFLCYSYNNIGVLSFSELLGNTRFIIREFDKTHVDSFIIDSEVRDKEICEEL